MAAQEEGGDVEEGGVSRRLEAESLAEQEVEQRQAVDVSAAALRKLDAALHRAATRAEAAALEAKAAVEAEGVSRGQVRRTARALEEAEEEARQVASEVPSRMDSIRGASEARMPDVVARWLEVDDDAEPMEEEEEGWAEEEGEESADGPVPMEDAETSDGGAEALVSRLRDGELQLEVTRRRRQELVRKLGTAESLQAFLDAAGASEGGVGLLEQLQILQIKAETVTSSIASLRAGIGQMEGKVSAANAETVRAVAARTGELFEVLVPQLEVEIACADPGRLGESSARFRFRSRGAAAAAVAAADRDEGAWRESLDELSGGQRTLLNMCVLLAVAQHRPSMVLLLDEIDAALDEANAAKVAALLKRLSATSQVIAISHRPEFQAMADNCVKLARRGEHTVVL